MCTAISFSFANHFFGRNLDLDHAYDESVTVTPRNYPLSFKSESPVLQHLAFIGMATVADGYPLYYDATNECGLSIAALNFPGNAQYHEKSEIKRNIASFEIIPWIMCQCKTTQEAESLLKQTNIINISYNKLYAVTPLHWIISDRQKSITVETTVHGMNIYDNPVGVLTNNPTFEFHMQNLCNYLHLDSQLTQTYLAQKFALTPHSNGTASIGLPGDPSSMSRFIRAVFNSSYSVCEPHADAELAQCFHVLNSVAQVNGCCSSEHGYTRTIYSSCCDTESGIYYYTTYENQQLTAVGLRNTDLNTDCLTSYPIRRKQSIYQEN